MDYFKNHDPDHQWFVTTITIFVALGPSPVKGLDGTLSVMVLPYEKDWLQVSLMAKLELKYNFPTIFVCYQFYT